VVAFTRLLAGALAGRRIRVDCVRPDPKDVADAVLDLLSTPARR
jgi:hypothetical protein